MEDNRRPKDMGSPANPIAVDRDQAPPPNFTQILSSRSTPVWIFLVAIAAVIGGLLLLVVRP